MAHQKFQVNLSIVPKFIIYNIKAILEKIRVQYPLSKLVIHAKFPKRLKQNYIVGFYIIFEEIKNKHWAKLIKNKH